MINEGDNLLVFFQPTCLQFKYSILGEKPGSLYKRDRQPPAIPIGYNIPHILRGLVEETSR